MKGQGKDKTRNRFCRLFLVLMVMIIGLAFTGKGAYIQSKAVLAQGLMALAWQRNLETGEPQKPWPWADIKPIGKLIVDRLEVEQIMLDSHAGEALAFGPGLVRGETSLSNTSSSNTTWSNHPVWVVAGHRDTHFRFLEKLLLKDVIRLSIGSGETVAEGFSKDAAYAIQSMQVMDSRIHHLPLNATENTLYLVTCYPFNEIRSGGPLRYVVTATQVPSSRFF